MRLEMNDYQVLMANDGKEALDMLQSVTPHLVIADVMMPRVNGWELFERMRADPRWNQIPFIFATARTDDELIQRGKGLGAEDYLTKPFKVEELEAVIRGKLLRAAQLKKLKDFQDAGLDLAPIQISDLTIDLKAHRVFRGDTEINFSPTEFSILAHLSKKPGQVSTFDELSQICFSNSFDAWDAQDSIRVHIKNIRKKLEQDFHHSQYIVNVRGVGYRLEALAS